MIFVTVGSQMPFDRLVAAVDRWASVQNPARSILIQTCGGEIVPKFANAVPNLSPAQFERACANSDLVIAHAGMGSIITALAMAKPIVIMPRQGALRETRNDHQLATARWLSSRPGVFVAENEVELPKMIQLALQHQGGGRISADAPQAFLDAINRFIERS